MLQTILIIIGIAIIVILLARKTRGPPSRKATDGQARATDVKMS